MVLTLEGEVHARDLLSLLIFLFIIIFLLLLFLSPEAREAVRTSTHAQYQVLRETRSVPYLPEDGSLSGRDVDQLPDPPASASKVELVLSDVIGQVSKTSILPALLDSFLPLTL